LAALVFCLVRCSAGEAAGDKAGEGQQPVMDAVAPEDRQPATRAPVFTSEPYGLAISKQHPDFVRFVNAVLQQLRTNGQWAASYAHWVGTPAPAPPPAHYSG